MRMRLLLNRNEPFGCEEIIETTPACAVLLIVSDDRGTLQQLNSLLSPHFKNVLNARNSLEAEILVAAECVTHLICSNTTASHEPDGVALISFLREKQPEIRRAVLLADEEDGQKTVRPGVDAVITETADAASSIGAPCKKQTL